MRPLIAGNWKMNGTRAEARAIAQGVRDGAARIDCGFAVFPPFTAIETVAAVLAGTGIVWGGQDCNPDPAGAHTGDVAAPMLAELGCAAVILGHSERRQDHGETSLLVRRKVEAAQAASLDPIVCVGETEAEREAGAAEAVVCAQIAESLPPGFAGVVAYEPVWAIGSGRTSTQAEITAMHATIRRALLAHLGAPGGRVKILYGGSVKPDNAASLLHLPEVGGALVGGASLKAADFLAIAAEAASRDRV